MTHEDAQRRVHEAIGALLDDDEFAMSWVLTIDVAGPDDRRYLAHRSGGGADGSEEPAVWTALGMLRADVLSAEAQIVECTSDADTDDEDG